MSASSNEVRRPSAPQATVRAVRGSGRGNLVRDALLVSGRNLRVLQREPQLIVMAAVQPVMLVLLFNYVFGGAVNVPADGVDYTDLLVAAVIVQAAAFASATTGALSLLAAFGVAVGVGFAFTWIAVWIGAVARNPETAQPAAIIWLFPLSFASSAFVPVESFPTWLETFAKVNPITHFADAIRVLTLDVESGTSTVQTERPVLLSIAWMVGSPRDPSRRRSDHTSERGPDPEFRAAVEATGRRKLIMAGITTDMCLAAAVVTAVRGGYDVQVVIDASATWNEQIENAAMMRMTQAGAQMRTWVELAAELAGGYDKPYGDDLQRLYFDHLAEMADLVNNFSVIANSR